MNNVIVALFMIGFFLVSTVDAAQNTVKAWVEYDIACLNDADLMFRDGESNATQTITGDEFCLMAVQLLEKIFKKNIGQLLVESDEKRILPASFLNHTDYAVRAAYRLGITKGLDDGLFLSPCPLTREQVAVLITNTAIACDFYVDTELKRAGSPQQVKDYYDTLYQDMVSVSDWARKGVVFVSDFDIMEAVADQEFAPQQPCKRQQVSAAMSRLYEKISTLY